VITRIVQGLSIRAQSFDAKNAPQGDNIAGVLTVQGHPMSRLDELLPWSCTPAAADVA
jgi:hypothetical protein